MLSYENKCKQKCLQKIFVNKKESGTKKCSRLLIFPNVHKNNHRCTSKWPMWYLYCTINQSIQNNDLS